MRKNKWVVTPRCAAAAIVSAVVLRRPTKEYTHRYSMMHHRLTTAGIEVAPHYDQLLLLVSICALIILMTLYRCQGTTTTAQKQIVCHTMLLWRAHHITTPLGKLHIHVVDVLTIYPYGHSVNSIDTWYLVPGMQYDACVVPGISWSFGKRVPVSFYRFVFSLSFYRFVFSLSFYRFRYRYT